MSKDKYEWRFFNNDFASLYPTNILNNYSPDDLIMVINRNILKKQRIEKLNKINEKNS